MIVFDETADISPEVLEAFDIWMDAQKRAAVEAFRREMKRPESPLMQAVRAMNAQNASSKP